MYYWRVSPSDVNKKPRLSLNEKKTRVALALTSTEYKINRMNKGYYQAAMQSMQLPYCFYLLLSLLLIFFTRLTIEGERETSVRFIEESSQRKSSSLIMGRGRAEEVMENYPIIVDELFVLKGCLTEEIAVSKKKVRGSRSPAAEVKHT